MPPRDRRNLKSTLAFVVLSVLVYAIPGTLDWSGRSTSQTGVCQPIEVALAGSQIARRGSRDETSLKTKADDLSRVTRAQLCHHVSAVNFDRART